MVLEIKEVFKNEISMKKLEFISRICPVMSSCKIKLDAQKLKLILFNLMQNAFKYTRSGTVSVKADILNRDKCDTYKN